MAMPAVWRPLPPRVAAWAIVAAGLALATWGLLTAAWEIPAPGLDIEAPPGQVLAVLPGGPAWRAGIRPGQMVVEVSPGETELDWALHTQGAGIDYFLTARADAAELRGLLPLTLAGLVLALVAAALAVPRPRPAAALASLGGALGAVPLTFGGGPLVSSAGALVMLALPAGYLVALGWRSRTARLAAIAAATVVGLAWLVARFLAPDAFEAANAVRLVAAALLAAAAIVATMDRAGLRPAIRSLGTATALDLAVAPVALGLALAAWIVGDASPILLGAALAVAAVAYLRARRPIARAVDRALFDPLRERASIVATEAERGRLAREIHDEPLQELGGVIARLERHPAVAVEADSLRGVATQLRSLATGLQPPVLDELGLGSALAFLVQRVGTDQSAARATSAIHDETGVHRAARLPADVETALFRIAQEAVGNAVRHSGGTVVTLSGTLSPESADLTVADDGTGLVEPALERARRAGRLGLTSMRQRAAAIGAELSIGPGPAGGTSVHVTWSRR